MANCIYKYKGKDYTKDEFYSLVRTTMVQPKTVQKYTKILFPSGNTASKVEGHSTLEEFKKQKEDRIKELEEDKNKINLNLDNINTFNVDNNIYIKNGKTWELFNSGNFKEVNIDVIRAEIKKSTSIESPYSDLNYEINQLKQELERVETEGFGALKPIYNFYENTVTNILNKQFGKENVKVITDEYGNTWNEVEVKDQEVFLSTAPKLSKDQQFEFDKIGKLGLINKIPNANGSYGIISPEAEVRIRTLIKSKGIDYMHIDGNTLVLGLEEKEQTQQNKEPGVISSKADEITKNKVLNFLKLIGFRNIQIVKELRYAGEKLDDNAYVDLVNGIMQIVEGKEDYTLPEESMHILVALIKQSNSALYDGLMKDIINYKLYGQVLAVYKENKYYQNEDGTPNYNKIKEEAVAKLLAEYLINNLQNSAESSLKLEKVNSWWKDILEWIKTTFFNYKNPFKEALDRINEDEKSFGEFGDLTDPGVFLSAKSITEIDEENPENKTLWQGILTRPEDLGIEKVGPIYYKNKIQQNYTQDELDEMTVPDLQEAARELDISLRSSDKDKIILQIKAQQPKRVSDLTDQYYRGLFGNRNFDDALKDFYEQSRQDGDYLHEIAEEVIKSWIDPMTGLAKNIPSSITFPLEDNPIAKSTAQKLSIYINSLMKDYNKNYPGTRFIVEQIIYDKAKDRYGTIDFAAVRPNGTVDIFDWKSMLLEDPEGAKDYKKKGIAIQLNEYQRILKEEYGIEKFGKIRAIPIHKIYKVNKTTKERTLETINIGNQDASKITQEDRRLRPIISPKESSGSRQKDKIIHLLNEKYEDYIEKGYFKDNRSVLNTLTEAIYELHVGDTVDSLAIYFVDAGTEIKKLLSQKEAILASTRDEMNEVFPMINFYEDILNNVMVPAEQLIRDEDILASSRVSLDKSTNKLKFLHEDLKDLREKMLETDAARENVFNLAKPEKVVAMAATQFRAIGSQDIASTRYMYELARKAYNGIDFETDIELKKLKAHKAAFETWRKAKGFSTKDAINMFVDYQKGTIHNKISKDFQEQRDLVRSNSKAAEINKFIKDNYDTTEYIEWYNKTLNEIKENHKNTTYDQEDANKDKQIKRNIIKNFERDYNILTNPVTAFGAHNSRVWSKNLKEDLWYSEEYKKLLLPGNEVMLEFYNYMLDKNKELAETGAIKDKNVYTFFPNVRKGLADIMDVDNTSNIEKIRDTAIRLYTNWRKSISVDDYALNYSSVKDERGKEKRFVPFISYINPEDKSFDLFSIYGLMAKEIAKEKYLYRNEEIFRNILLLESEKKNIATKKDGSVVRGEDGEILTSEGINKNLKIVEGYFNYIVNGQSIQYDADAVITPRIREKWNNSWMGKMYGGKFAFDIDTYDPTKISATKFLMWLNTLNTKKTLGWNLGAITSNLFGGTYTSLKLYEKYTSKEDLHRSWYKLTSGNFFGSEEMKKNAALVDYFLPLLQNREAFKASQLSVNKAARILSQEWLMSPMRKTSEIVQLNIFLAVIENTGVIDGKLVNLRENAMKETGYLERYSLPAEDRTRIEKEFEKRLKSDKAEFGLTKLATYKTEGKDLILEIPGMIRGDEQSEKLREQVQTMSKDSLGEADEFDIAPYKFNIWWRMFMTFKNWIPRVADTRFGEFRLDQSHHSYEYGRYRMFGKMIASNWMNSVAKLVPVSYLVGKSPDSVGKEDMIVKARETYQLKKAEAIELNKYDERTFISEGEFIDKFIKGVNATYAEIRTLSTMMLFLFFGLAAPDPDDNSEERAYKALIRKQVDKLISEVGFFYSPKSFIDIAGGGLPLFSFVRDLYNLGTDVMQQFFGFTLKETGLWKEKGESLEEKAKPIKRFFKVFPVSKELLNYLPALDPELAKEWGVTITNTRSF